MTTKNESTWERDLAVLVAIAKVFDDNPGTELFTNEVADIAGVDQDTARRATAAWLEGGYLRGEDLSGYGDTTYTVQGLTEKGRRESGLWPNPEALTNQLLAILEQRINDTDDPDTRSRLQKARDGLKGVPREVLVSLIGSLGSGTILGY
jgi:hypothetical protein